MEDSVLKEQAGAEVSSEKTLDFYRFGLDQLEVTDDQLIKIANFVHLVLNARLTTLDHEKCQKKAQSMTTLGICVDRFLHSARRGIMRNGKNIHLHQ